MELKLYAGILLKRWRLIVAAFGITLLLTAILVSRQAWVYEATTTFVIRPSPEFNNAADDFVRAMDTLSRHTDINATFSQVAGSKTVKQQAIERLELSEQERKGLQVSGAAIAGSNILEISVRGPHPGIVRDMANAVGLETTTFMSGLYDVFVLEQLDEAGLPSTPVSPNKPLTIAVGAMMGLMLGIGLVFLADYLGQAVDEPVVFNIIDGDTGLYNRDYFFMRLAQEMSRAENSEHIFSLALIRLKSRRVATGITQPIPAAQAILPLMAALEQKIRKEDVVAHVDDDLFALLLPAMSKEAADGMLEPLQDQVRAYIYMSDHSQGDPYQVSSGAAIDAHVIAITYTSASLHDNAKALFEQAIDRMAQEEKLRQPEITNTGEDVTGLLFRPETEETDDSSRTPPRRNRGKKAGR